MGIANSACNSADLGPQIRPERSGAFRSPIPLAIRPIWGRKSGRSVPERFGAFRGRSGGQFRLQFGRFGGPISGQSVPAGRPAGPALGNRPIWGSETMTPLRYSGPPKKGGPHKLAVWGSAFWRLQSLFPPKGQSIWGSKSGRSIPDLEPQID